MNAKFIKIMKKRHLKKFYQKKVKFCVAPFFDLINDFCFVLNAQSTN